MKIITCRLAGILAGACLFSSAPLLLGEETAAPGSTIDAFHQALANGRREAALALLLPDAFIVEEGTVQSRTEYEKEHLDADITYARSVPSRRTSRKVMQTGETAVIISTYRTEGEFKGRTINRVAAETAVLLRGEAGWRIQSIHWSSHEARK